jgi:hypothetical protein
MRVAPRFNSAASLVLGLYLLGLPRMHEVKS